MVEVVCGALLFSVGGILMGHDGVLVLVDGGISKDHGMEDHDGQYEE